MGRGYATPYIIVSSPATCGRTFLNLYICRCQVQSLPRVGLWGEAKAHACTALFLGSSHQLTLFLQTKRKSQRVVFFFSEKGKKEIYHLKSFLGLHKKENGECEFHFAFFSYEKAKRKSSSQISCSAIYIHVQYKRKF